MVSYSNSICSCTKAYGCSIGLPAWAPCISIRTIAVRIGCIVCSSFPIVFACTTYISYILHSNNNSTIRRIVIILRQKACLILSRNYCCNVIFMVSSICLIYIQQGAEAKGNKQPEKIFVPHKNELKVTKIVQKLKQVKSEK